MKKRVIISSLIVLSLLMLVSIGFAGWVIANNVNESKTGNFTAYSVSSQTVTVGDISGSIILGKPSSMSATNPWLTADSDVATEQFTATFTITLANKGTGDVKLALSSDIVAKESPYASYGSQNYIAAPSFAVSGTGSSISGNVITLTANGTFTVTVTYGWGSAFAVESVNLNPYNYFNGGTQSGSDRLAGTSETTNVAAAQTALTAIKAIADGYNFKITVADAPSA